MLNCVFILLYLYSLFDVNILHQEFENNSILYKKKTLNKNPFISTYTCNQLNTVKLELTTEKTG
jgi:hypothetical protein